MWWRDLFDIAVRWRQASEPFDPVWWIDRLTAESFAGGFGLQTPMVRDITVTTDATQHLTAFTLHPVVEQVSGQAKVVRYYPMFERGFGMMRRLTAEQCPLTDDMREAVLSATTLEELYKIMKRDYWYGQGWCGSLRSLS